MLSPAFNFFFFILFTMRCLAACADMERSGHRCASVYNTVQSAQKCEHLASHGAVTTTKMYLKTLLGHTTNFFASAAPQIYVQHAHIHTHNHMCTYDTHTATNVHASAYHRRTQIVSLIRRITARVLKIYGIVVTINCITSLIVIRWCRPTQFRC